MKFIFFGTDDFSIAVLDELKNAGFLPALIITMPDRKKGRGLRIAPPLAKLWAQEHEIKFLQPEKLDRKLTTILQSMIVECFVLASYGKIFPKAILDIPEKGALNVHPSLLPKYRGPTPIESQILADEKEICVTIMLMDEKIDHGPIVASEKLKAKSENLKETPKASELRKELARLGGKLLAETLSKWISGKIKAVPQDERRATYTRKFTKSDGEINLSDDLYPSEAERRRRAYKNFLKIRAFDASIGTYFFKNNTRVIIKDAKFENGKLIITRVIPEGGKEMSYDEFLRGVR